MRKVTSLPVSDHPVVEGNFSTARGTITTIVLHSTSGPLSKAHERFSDPSGKVSAHYGIDQNGKIVHWVDETNTAYHAGNAVLNETSIGIELEDNDDYYAEFSEKLYRSLAKLVNDICNHYGLPIDRDHIIRHDEVPDVKTRCPGSLDADRVVREALELGKLPVEIETSDFTPLDVNSL
jgi:N-acetyl-anhydromuramyl-L-alanine amidase AmpD